MRQRSVLASCLAGSVEVSNAALGEAVRLNECEASGLSVPQSAALEVSTSSSSSVPLPGAGAW